MLTANPIIYKPFPDNPVAQSYADANPTVPNTPETWAASINQDATSSEKLAAELEASGSGYDYSAASQRYYAAKQRALAAAYLAHGVTPMTSFGDAYEAALADWRAWIDAHPGPTLTNFNGW